MNEYIPSDHKNQSKHPSLMAGWPQSFSNPRTACVSQVFHVGSLQPTCKVLVGSYVLCKELMFIFDRLGHGELENSSFSCFSTTLSSINKTLVNLVNPLAAFVYGLLLLHFSSCSTACWHVSSLVRGFQHLEVVPRKINQLLLKLRPSNRVEGSVLSHNAFKLRRLKQMRFFLITKLIRRFLFPFFRIANSLWSEGNWFSEWHLFCTMIKM